MIETKTAEKISADNQKKFLLTPSSLAHGEDQLLPDIYDPEGSRFDLKLDFTI
ncbi:MAG: hypothetical protein J6J21_05020 [Clostridia bacterium]|nr:hypothetical protein [Clostridia bacterium]